MTDNNNRSTLKEAFDAELMKRLEENPPEIPTYEEFSAMVDKSLAERCRRRKRIAGIAAGFVVVLLTGILACTNLTTDVDADKNPKEEIITEDGVIIEDGGWGSSEYDDNVWMTEEWDEVADAKEIYPQLMIPNYIPKGYAFKSLTIESFVEESITCEYIFKNEDQMVLEIEAVYLNSNLSTMDINNITSKIESEKGIIYIQKGEDNKIATIKTNDGVGVYISCNLFDEIIKDIVEGLNN